ncbi:MAG: transposase, partial [Myxococcota bacterium]|nr:transposase [Myxococcota bacterium]
QMERVLDTQYFHVVFTLPSELRDLATANPREVYGLLMRTAARTLIELGRDPQWLGAEVGITSVLHTWTRNLRLHPHVHCLVTGGGIDDEGCWRDAGSSFLAPVKVMGALFRGKFLAGLRSLRRRDKLSLEGRAEALAEPGAFETLVGRLYDKSWVVYAKRPMAGPEQVIAYLGRYTHRVAVSNNRILDVSEGHVTFRTRRDKTAKLSADQFVRRFLLHVLPKSFTKIRHYGILASPNLATLWVA